MKQLIVLVATIILGITIGGIILGFRGTTTSLGTTVTNSMESISDTMSEAAIQATTVTP
ncbi:MAG: hypothetical protein MJ150_05960 [Clostridia bacterium]|nr:hypothetical protein [Clostridia bacterium]